MTNLQQPLLAINVVEIDIIALALLSASEFNFIDPAFLTALKLSAHRGDYQEFANHLNSLHNAAYNT